MRASGASGDCSSSCVGAAFNHCTSETELAVTISCAIIIILEGKMKDRREKWCKLMVGVFLFLILVVVELMRKVLLKLECRWLFHSFS